MTPSFCAQVFGPKPRLASAKARRLQWRRRRDPHGTRRRFASLLRYDRHSRQDQRSWPGKSRRRVDRVRRGGRLAERGNHRAVPGFRVYSVPPRRGERVGNAGAFDLAGDAGELLGGVARLGRIIGAAELADPALAIKALTVRRVARTSETGAAGVAQAAAALVILHGDTRGRVPRLGRAWQRAVADSLPGGQGQVDLGRARELRCRGRRRTG